MFKVQTLEPQIHCNTLKFWVYLRKLGTLSKFQIVQIKDEDSNGAYCMGLFLVLNELNMHETVYLSSFRV